MEEEINYEHVGEPEIFFPTEKKRIIEKKILDKEELEDLDYAIQKCVTLPNLLFKTAKKYDISLSDAIREGVYLLLNTDENFILSKDRYEETLKSKGKYAAKRDMHFQTIQKLTGAK